MDDNRLIYKQNGGEAAQCEICMWGFWWGNKLWELINLFVSV